MDLIFDDTGYGELMPAGKCSIPIKGDRVKKQIDPVFQGQGPGQGYDSVQNAQRIVLLSLTDSVFLWKIPSTNIP